MCEQIQLLELAMIQQRTWTGGQHRVAVLDHPSLRHPARRLVWLGFDERANPEISFRIGADGAATDRDGRTIGVDSARIAVAHPLQLAEELPYWVSQFTDHELRQPFPQLAREVHALTERERTATSLERFAHRMVPTHALLRLEDFGWRRGAPVDGVHDHFYRPVEGDLQVLLHLDDGIAVEDPAPEGERVIEAVELSSPPVSSWWRRCGDTAFGALDPITASEVLRELAAVFD
ncbi:DUF4132 domain-containing protein [Nocardia sp. NPDC050713]|uniref:DUF4132 domain-containing protein n=1 Tax=unclassified Nocardia TaxID=2637762 RepID=UPI0033B422D5